MSDHFLIIFYMHGCSISGTLNLFFFKQEYYILKNKALEAIVLDWKSIFQV